MGFFSRKSKDPNPVNDAVNRSIKEAEQQQDTQIKLVEVRKTKEDIDNDFFDLVTSREVAEKSHKAAQANESKLEKLEQADAANKATGKENVSKLWEMEKDIYIIPGGYEAVETGADQLYPYIKKYVNSLRSAIESGRAMKANACIDMLRYVLSIGYRYEDAATPEKFDERVQKPKEKSILDEPQTMIVLSEHGNFIYALSKPGSGAKLFEVEEGTRVTVYARQNGFALAVTEDGAAGGWMSEKLLEKAPAEGEHVAFLQRGPEAAAKRSVRRAAAHEGRVAARQLYLCAHKAGRRRRDFYNPRGLDRDRLRQTERLLPRRAGGRLGRRLDEGEAARSGG